MIEGKRQVETRMSIIYLKLREPSRWCVCHGLPMSALAELTVI